MEEAGYTTFIGFVHSMERGAYLMELLFGVVCFGIIVLNIGYCLMDNE
ncbi:hypothetical protein [Oceanobacillus iheyensis]|nr:hypothetical protein [Oceanobacillus iheyensis]